MANSKKSVKNENMSLRWDYKDGDVWKGFNPDIQKKIESSLKAKRKTLKIYLNNDDKRQILLEKLEMTSEKDGINKLRVAVHSNNEWILWHTESNEYFKPQEIKKLESVYSHKKEYASLKVVVQGTSYDVDLVAMKIKPDRKLIRVIDDAIEDGVFVSNHITESSNANKETKSRKRKIEVDAKIYTANCADDDGGKKGRKERANLKNKIKDQDKPAPLRESNKNKKVVKKASVKKEDEDDMDIKPKTATKNKKKTNKKLPKNAAKNENENRQVAKALPKVLRLNKGSLQIPVDVECLKEVPDARVYIDEEYDMTYDCMLNQTNIQHNNNKFYIIQLVEGNKVGTTASNNNNGGPYHVWMRWGRVGVAGQSTLKSFNNDIFKAIDCFEKKFYAKTLNEWQMKDFFEKCDGKYDLIKIEYDLKKKNVVDKTKGVVVEMEPEEIKVPESKLHVQLQALIRMIYDIEEMEGTVKEMHYDAVKTPLGQLTQHQINQGFKTLKHIDQLINGNQTGDSLLMASNMYYTQVPHYFGMSRPPIINSKQLLLKEIKLLETLGEIEVAVRILKESAMQISLNPLDSRYQSLNNCLLPLEPLHPDFQMVEKYLLNTHGDTHTAYRMSLLEVFAVERSGEGERFKDVGNNMLLWHGSRISNMVGVLSQGLRIAPPEAPSTGYMFGKGIYFADMSSKSANYCHTNRHKNVGFLLLSQVSLGEMNELFHADYNANHLPSNKNSVKGMGRVRPRPSGNITWANNILVPCGKGIEGEKEDEKEEVAGKRKRRSAKWNSMYSLYYNEYIVYDPAQVRLRFLVKVQFHFK